MTTTPTQTREQRQVNRYRSNAKNAGVSSFANLISGLTKNKKSVPAVPSTPMGQDIEFIQSVLDNVSLGDQYDYASFDITEEKTGYLIRLSGVVEATTFLTISQVSMRRELTIVDAAYRVFQQFSRKMVDQTFLYKGQSPVRLAFNEPTPQKVKLPTESLPYAEPKDEVYFRFSVAPREFEKAAFALKTVLGIPRDAARKQLRAPMKASGQVFNVLNAYFAEASLRSRAVQGQ